MTTETLISKLGTEKPCFTYCETSTLIAPGVGV
jgi:hypothetical protein